MDRPRVAARSLRNTSRCHICDGGFFMPGPGNPLKKGRHCHAPTTPETPVKALGLVVKRLAARVGTWVARLASRAAARYASRLSRLSQRWHADSVYRRTLVAAISAISATVLPHPAAAAAVGALLADRPHRPSSRVLRLRPGRRRLRASPRPILAAPTASGTPPTNTLKRPKRSLPRSAALHQPGGVPFALLGHFGYRHRFITSNERNVMSGYSIEVSGPSAKLAMLRALAHKMLGRLSNIAAAVKVTLTRSARVAKAATTTGLALIGSQAGYQLVRHGVRALVTGAVRLASSGLRLICPRAKAVGRVLMSGLATVSPTAADVTEHVVQQWVVQPVSDVAVKVTGWVRDVADAVWDLSDSGLVKAVTIRSAQAASLVLAVHTITKGAAAAKVVQALPWAMDVVVTVTNPAKVAPWSGSPSSPRLAVAAMRILDTEGPDDEPDEVDTEGVPPQETTEPGRPQLVRPRRARGRPAGRRGEAERRGRPRAGPRARHSERAAGRGRTAGRPDRGTGRDPSARADPAAAQRPTGTTDGC